MSALFSRILEMRNWPAIAGWLVTVVLLGVGTPLFLRMPLWGDSTLYQVSAHNMLSGGVHYRDVFDTNPPAFSWVLCAVQSTLGTSSEAVRLVDLAIVIAVTIFLLYLARSAGATHAGLAWTSAAIAALYPFSHEFNHVQRDVWMMLPALGAVGLRLRRLDGVHRPSAMSFLEGLLWGLACWVKPHMLLIAACVWLISAVRIGRARAIVRDFISVFSGGIVAGLIGFGWLIQTGAWPYFLDVFRNWNTAYATVVYKELPFKIFNMQLNYFPPYSCFVLLAVPLAYCNLRHRSSTDHQQFRRSMLAACYLSWLIVTIFFQRPFHYAHVPETLLMLALFAANRWPVPAAIVLVQLIVGIIAPFVEKDLHMRNNHHQFQEESWLYRTFSHQSAMFDANRTGWWCDCFDAKPSPETRKGVAMWPDHFGGQDPVELGAVEDYLRTQDVRDGELIAWHDSPHALYLALDIKPGFRFMHVGTAYSLGPWQREQVKKELLAALPHARFAVSDLHRITRKRDKLNEIGPDGLPLVVPAWQKEEFPLNQPVTFRSPSGRYLVHAISRPVMSCAIPETLDQQKP
jgi:hypothetical protein